MNIMRQNTYQKLLACMVCLIISMPAHLYAKQRYSYTSEINNAINNSSSPIDLLNRISNIHKRAYEHGDDVVYPKNRTLEIEIPQGFMPIRLTEHTDFNGCTFKVDNKWKKVFLFEMTSRQKPIAVVVGKSLLIENATIALGTQGPKLLLVKDENLWTNRYDYNSLGEIFEIKQKCYRKDLLFIDGNVVKNSPIASYDNSVSAPSFKYIDITTNKKKICNLNLIRKESSTAVTNFLRVEYQFNLLLENITIETRLQPEEKDRFYYDQCFLIDNSAKIRIDGITVHNTYSSQTIWGYAFEMNNVWDCTFENTNISAIRGGLNTTCVSSMNFKNCTLNRVDVHYYGKDVVCQNCTFKNDINSFHVYNRFSSFYGTLRYTNCLFDHFLPVRIDSEYNAYTPFVVEIDDCTLRIAYEQPSKYNCICHIPILDSVENERPELKVKCLPNLSINKLKIDGPSAVKDFFYFKIDRLKYSGHIAELKNIKTNNITFAADKKTALSLHHCNVNLPDATGLE